MATRTWNGGSSTTNNWTDAANWGGTAPVAGDDLVFAGTTRLSPVNDFTAGTSFRSITFNAGAGAFNITGNAIVLSGGTAAIASNITTGSVTLALNLSFSTASPTIANASGGTLVLSGTVATTGYTVTYSSSGSMTVSGAISGSGNINVNGSVTFSGTSTSFSGQFIVLGGTVSITGTLTGLLYFVLFPAYGTCACNVTGTVSVQANGSAIFGVGTGAVGTGTLTISGSGSVTVGAGAVCFIGGGNSGGPYGTGILTISGGTFQIDAGGAFPNDLCYISGYGGAGTINLDGGTIISSRSIQNGNGTSIFNFNGGTLKAGAAISVGNGCTNNIRNGGALFDTNGYTLTIDGVLAHSNIGGDAATDGGVTKSGTGTLLIPTTNTYTGGTTASAGTLELNNSQAVGTTGTLTISGATLLLSAALSCAALSYSSGVLNINGKNLTTTANLTVATGTVTTFAGLGGSVITVGGNASFAGQSANLLNLHPGSGSAFTLAVTGTLTADYCRIGKNTASVSAGTPTRSINAGGVSGWNFSYFWNANTLITTPLFDYAFNWFDGQAGVGAHPLGAKDDNFLQASLDTGIWTFHEVATDNLGSGTVSGGYLTMDGTGQDIWLGAKGYVGIYRSDITGDDLDVCVHVQSQGTSDGWAKCGILISNNPTDWSLGGVAFVAITPSNGAILQWCTGGGGNGWVDGNAQLAGTTPCYLRLVRRGTTLYAYYKKNLSDSWSLISSQTTAGIALGTNSTVELFSTAHNTGVHNTVIMDSFKAGRIADTNAALSLNGVTGSGVHSNGTLSADLTVKSLDCSGANNYNGILDLNAKTLTLSGSLSFSQTAMTVKASGGGTISASGAIPFTANLSLRYSNGNSVDTLTMEGAGVLTITGGTLTLTANPNPPTQVLPLIAKASGSITGPFGTVSGLPTGFALRYIGTRVELVPKQKASDFTPFFGA